MHTPESNIFSFLYCCSRILKTMAGLPARQGQLPAWSSSGSLKMYVKLIRGLTRGGSEFKMDPRRFAGPELEVT